MVEIVYVYNYGGADFIDGFKDEKICIKSRESKPMTSNMARYFVGDGTPKGTADATFRRGGNAPTLKILESEEERMEYTKGIPSAPKSIIGTDEEIAFGKFLGEKWDDVLSPERFDAAFWKASVRVAKKIPDKRKTQIYALLEENDKM